jgi:hypothetical protein
MENGLPLMQTNSLQTTEELTNNMGNGPSQYSLLIFLFKVLFLPLIFLMIDVMLQMLQTVFPKFGKWVLKKENLEEKQGREWALGDEAGFTSEKMGYRVIESLDKLFNTWKPREKYELIKVDARKPKHSVHTLEY